MLKNEYILCAAIHYDDGIERIHQPKNIETGFVVCGRRHHNCITTVGVFGKRSADYAGRMTHGFLTNKDRFIGRKEAVCVALFSGQIEKSKSELFSEDLY